jgi:hypothetical protein
MCPANPLWGAAPIHGELLKLGIEVSEATVSKFMVKRRFGWSDRSLWRPEDGRLALQRALLAVQCESR